METAALQYFRQFENKLVAFDGKPPVQFQIERWNPHPIGHTRRRGLDPDVQVASRVQLSIQLYCRARRLQCRWEAFSIRRLIFENTRKFCIESDRKSFRSDLQRGWCLRAQILRSQRQPQKSGAHDCDSI